MYYKTINKSNEQEYYQIMIVVMLMWRNGNKDIIGACIYGIVNERMDIIRNSAKYAWKNE